MKFINSGLLLWSFVTLILVDHFECVAVDAVKSNDLTNIKSLAAEIAEFKLKPSEAKKKAAVELYRGKYRTLLINSYNYVENLPDEDRYVVLFSISLRTFSLFFFVIFFRCFRKHCHTDLVALMDIEYDPQITYFEEPVKHDQFAELEK